MASPGGNSRSRRPNKRPNSPAAATAGGKRRRPGTPSAAAATAPEAPEAAAVSQNPAAATAVPEATPVKQFVFKDQNFVHSGKGGVSAGKKTKTWKNLKQILAMERALPWKPEDPTYSSLDGPPSFKPAKKYSDLSGLPASYTDPHTKIRYANTDEFSRIRMLPSDIVTGYLALRRANTPVP
ncbi:INO80 complex subunit C-like [Branchiostoma floridae x Branchiostoma japonicum]